MRVPQDKSSTYSRNPPEIWYLATRTSFVWSLSAVPFTRKPKKSSFSLWEHRGMAVTKGWESVPRKELQPVAQYTVQTKDGKFPLTRISAFDWFWPDSAGSPSNGWSIPDYGGGRVGALGAGEEPEDRHGAKSRNDRIQRGKYPNWWLSSLVT